MTTATVPQPAKLTLKQSFLVNLLRGMYFVWGPWMSHDDPRRTEIHELLDKADHITGDERAIFIRKVSTCSPQLSLQELHGLEMELEELIDVRYNALKGEDDRPREV